MTEAVKASRALAAAVEPLAAQVYFAPECHEAYQELGFSPSPKTSRGVAMPDGPAYFCSRGSVLGQVPGEVVAATFAVFNPAVVVPAVSHGWTLTDATTMCAVRDAGAVAQLERILGPELDGVDRAAKLLERAGSTLRPEGRPLYAGLLRLAPPDHPLGLVWRLPARSYIRTRAWSGTDLDTAEVRLRDRGLLADAALTEQGRAAREEIERATDRQRRPIVDALGDDLDELLGSVSPWAAEIRNAGGYPASGPHDLAG